MHNKLSYPLQQCPSKFSLQFTPSYLYYLRSQTVQEQSNDFTNNTFQSNITYESSSDIIQH